MGRYLNSLIERESLLNEISENYILEDDKVKIIPDLPTLRHPQKVQKVQGAPEVPGVAPLDTAPPPTATDADQQLLDRYRRGGANLSLETVTHDGAQWRALACELSGVPEANRDHAFAQMHCHARRLQSALEAEAKAARAP